MAKINVDLRLVDARSEIAALRHSVQTLEEQLEFLVAQRRHHVIADLGPNPDQDAVHAALQVLSHAVEHTYPRVYRGALLLLIWASYESVVCQVAEFLRERKGIPLTLSETRERGVLRKAKVYFPRVLEIELFGSPDSSSRLGQLQILRNSFAHAGGRIAGLGKTARRTALALERAGLVSEDWGYLVPTKKGLEAALAVVDAEVSSLLRRAIAWDDSSNSDPAPPL